MNLENGNESVSATPSSLSSRQTLTFFSLIKKKKSIKRNVTVIRGQHHYDEAMQMRPIDSSERLAKKKKTHTHTQAAWDPTLTDPIQLFVHLCLRGSKIKTRAFSLIRPLSSSRVWRQNGVGTMTPHRWWLTPSPNAADGATKTGPHLTCTPPSSSSSLTPRLTKEPVRMGPPPSGPSTPHCCHRPWG